MFPSLSKECSEIQDEPSESSPNDAQAHRQEQGNMSNRCLQSQLQTWPGQQTQCHRSSIDRIQIPSWARKYCPFCKKQMWQGSSFQYLSPCSSQPRLPCVVMFPNQCRAFWRTSLHLTLFPGASMLSKSPLQALTKLMESIDSNLIKLP